MSKVFTLAEGLENMGAIKSGGQGSVYKGRRTGEIITAIKLLPTPLINPSPEDKHFRDFTNEVKKLQRVNEEPNPNVVKILSYGVSETGGFPYIEMEYIDGPDLGELLKPPHEPVFSVKEAIKVADHLSNALAHCHRVGVKHGDIKSNNVKYNRNTGNYVLLDFGLAILSDEERRTSMRHAGAIEFMAPEQNEGRMLFQTDVYSFGIVLYEVLAGKVPFPLDGNSETARNKVMVAHMEAAPPNLLSLRAAALPLDWSEEKKSLERQVPEWLLKMLDKCLQKNPEDRFADAVELHDYISHHRVYTAEVARMVHNEDDKWQAVVKKKEAEIAELRSALAQKNKEAFATNRETVYSETPRRGASKPAMTALLLLLLLTSGLAVYGLFFRHPVVNGMQADNRGVPVDSTADKLSSENSGAGFSQTKTPAKPSAKTAAEKRKALRDSMAQTVRNSTDGNEEQQAAALAKEAESNEDASKKEGADKKADENNDSNDGTAVRYKVRNVAYFHNEPDASTRRNAFINHWNNAVLKPLDEKNGFVYIVYTNTQGQTSKGWLNKEDLVAVK